MAYIVNWREFRPDIAHDNAVHWGGLRRKDREEEDPRHCLEKLRGFAIHALQGRKPSDHHKHENQEQVYYVLSGAGEALFDERRYPVEKGDAIYLPAGVYHQMFNDGEAWLSHHVISMPVEGNGGTFLIRSWRDVPPVGDGVGAVRWRQLGQEDEDDGGVLRGMAFIDREAIQPRGRSAERRYDDLEQVYYVLEGGGTISIDGQETGITEGDMIHLPPEATYYLSNRGEGWLTYMIMAAR